MAVRRLPDLAIIADAGMISERKHDSNEARLTLVFAALTASRWSEAQTSWPIRKSS